MSSGCSDLPVCSGEIGDYSLDPNGSRCTKQCECNNQQYTGYCNKAGLCRSVPREPCLVKGNKRSCILLQAVGNNCKSGIQVCQPKELAESYWGDCKPLPAEKDENGREFCFDGIDNDCDGLTDLGDEDCAKYCNVDDVRVCYGEGKEKLDVAKQNTGVCRTGIQTCGANKEWGKCIGYVTPKSKDICNGLDDDCDGYIDNDPGKKERSKRCQCFPPGIQQPCFTGDDKNRNKGVCASGVQFCKDDGSWGTCVGDVLPADEICNLKDDDCDGQIDNNKGGGLSSLSKPCYTGKTGCTFDNDANKYICQNACQAGTRACKNGVWEECKGEVTPKAEVCNGKDDDCNGKVDDNIQVRPLCRNQRGICKWARAQSERCQNGEWQPCTAKDYQANDKRYQTKEVCDGVDNNCDGRVNESTTQCVGLYTGSTLSGYADGFATDARFDGISSIAVDNQGNLYIVDGNTRIRKMDRCGQVRTLAGTTKSGYLNAARDLAQFGLLIGIALTHTSFESIVTMYVSDSRNNRIRKMDSRRTYDFIGSGKEGNKDGPLRTAELYRPGKIAMDANQNYLLIVEPKALRLVNLKASSPTLQTIARLGSSGYRDGPIKQALFPASLREAVVDSNGTIYFSDERSHTIRKIQSVSGQTCGSQSNYTGYCVSTVAGSGKSGYQDGKGKAASFKTPGGLTIDKRGHLYVIDKFNYRIRKIDTLGNVSTIAGSGKSGVVDGSAKQSQLQPLEHIAVDNIGNLYVADRQSIRKIRLNPETPPDYCVSIYSGSNTGYVDGTNALAKFTRPTGFTLDKDGSLYVMDFGNHRIRKVDIYNRTMTYAGSGFPGYLDGPAIGVAQLRNPSKGVIGPKGNLYFIESSGSLVRKVDTKGHVSTYAGSGQRGDKDGPALQASFKYLNSIAIDKQGQLYLGDSSGFTIRKVDTKGQVTTVVGSYPPGYVDGDFSKAKFKRFGGMTLDQKGNLYVADVGAHRIRKIDFVNKKVTTVAGTGKYGFKDGDLAQAQFGTIEGMTVGPLGHLYIADSGNARVRMLDFKKKTVVTIAGARGNREFTGAGNKVFFLYPTDVAVTPEGTIFVVDASRHHIRVIRPKTTK